MEGGLMRSNVSTYTPCQNTSKNKQNTAEHGKHCKTPAADLTHEVVNLMRQNGVLINKNGIYGNTTKIRPPMPFSRENADRLRGQILDGQQKYQQRKHKKKSHIKTTQSSNSDQIGSFEKALILIL